jgi:CDP-glucose 4,6-dehydratase
MSWAQGSVAPLLLDGTFRGRRVLVTGHTGFKGSWLCLWLHELGATVSGFALDPPTQPSNFEAAAVDRLLAHDVRADIRDRPAVLDALAATQPDIILHLAARTVVRDSFVNPLETISVNALGTAALLDAVRLRRQGCVVVVVSSDKCYANDESGRPFVEGDPLGGDDPYSASKAAVEVITHAYRRSFFPPEELARHGVAVATARAGNVVGGGDWTTDGLVADVMRGLHAEEPVAIRYPSAVRPWQHVLDPLAGYLVLANRLLGPDAGRFCTAWNFGPAEANFETVAQLVDRLVHAWQEKGGRWEPRRAPGDRHEATLLRLSSANAARELGWRSRWSIGEVVQRTVGWYRAYHSDPTAARDACLRDIVAYTSATC